MTYTVIFAIGSLIIIWISIPSFRRPGSHGFFRFFAWEIILGLFSIQLSVWFTNPFSWYQAISWALLLASLIPLILGVILLRRVGKPTDQLEATTKLVTTGIYQFIRHPLYASLLYLTWGLFFKSPNLLGICLSSVSTSFLYATARADESECLEKFGDEYARYLSKTKMFIPYVF